VSNVANLVDGDGKPHFKYVIEGANLFFTQQARLFLEKKGVVLFKDASTNKGGVTSSSLEVLAGLSLKDEEYGELMMVKSGKPSSFCALLLSCTLGRVYTRNPLTLRFQLCQRHSTKDLRKRRGRIRVHHERVEPPKGWRHAYAPDRPALVGAQRAAKRARSLGPVRQSRLAQKRPHARLPQDVD
jgi:glutamate dehydrogenase